MLENRDDVGSEKQDYIKGATTIRLLRALGLQERHTVLDFGCGSLSIGRILIPYLEPGNYTGVASNKSLTEAAIRDRVGQDLVDTKRPSFHYNQRFEVQGEHDFIVAPSVFLHTGVSDTLLGLKRLSGVVKDDGIILVTFFEGVMDNLGEGWFYPLYVEYSRPMIQRFVREAGLTGKRLPWHDSKLAWYPLAKGSEHLPSQTTIRSLSRSILKHS